MVQQKTPNNPKFQKKKGNKAKKLAKKEKKKAERAQKLNSQPKVDKKNQELTTLDTIFKMLSKSSEEKVVNRFMTEIRSKAIILAYSKKDVTTLLSTLMGYALFDVSHSKSFTPIYDSTQKMCFAKFFECFTLAYSYREDFVELMEELTSKYDSLKKELKLLATDIPEDQSKIYKKIKFDKSLDLDEGGNKFKKFLLLLKIYQFKSNSLTSDVIHDMMVCFDKIFVKKDTSPRHLNILLDCLLATLSRASTLLPIIKDMLSLVVDRFEEDQWNLLFAVFDEKAVIKKEGEKESKSDDEESEDEEESEEESESDEEESEGESDDEDESDNNSSSESSDEEEDDNDSSEEEDEKPSKKMKIDKQVEEEEEELPDMDDDEMLKRDEALASIFRLKKMTESNTEAQKQNSKLFKSNSFDLIIQLAKIPKLPIRSTYLLFEFFTQQMTKMCNKLKEQKQKLLPLLQKTVKIWMDLFRSLKVEDFKNFATGKIIVKHLKTMFTIPFNNAALFRATKKFCLEKIPFFLKVIGQLNEEETTNGAYDIIEKLIFNFPNFSDQTPEIFQNILSQTPDWIRVPQFVAKVDEKISNEFRKHILMKIFTIMMKKKYNKVIDGDEFQKIVNFGLDVCEENEKPKKKNAVAKGVKVISAFTAELNDYIKTHEQIGKKSKSSLLKLLQFFIDHPKTWRFGQQNSLQNSLVAIGLISADKVKKLNEKKPTIDKVEGKSNKNDEKKGVKRKREEKGEAIIKSESKNVKTEPAKKKDQKPAEKSEKNEPVVKKSENGKIKTNEKVKLNKVEKKESMNTKTEKVENEKATKPEKSGSKRKREEKEETTVKLDKESKKIKMETPKEEPKKNETKSQKKETEPTKKIEKKESKKDKSGVKKK